MFSIKKYTEVKIVLLPCLMLFTMLSSSTGHRGSVYRCEAGKITIVSEAPLEIIRAQSNHLKGAYDTERNSFAWTVEVKSFEGFNSPLQREHFNENYLETVKYPRASFQGKIIEEIDLLRDGTHTVRAKGLLNVHGVQRERIVKGQLEKRGNNLRIKAQFTVPLADHGIEIPRVVFQKIAEEITVTVDALFSQQ